MGKVDIMARGYNHSCSLNKTLLRLYFSWGYHGCRLTSHDDRDYVMNW